MPPAIFFARLDLEQKYSFLHWKLNMCEMPIYGKFVSSFIFYSLLKFSKVSIKPRMSESQGCPKCKAERV
jgi:hypothetical protein